MKERKHNFDKLSAALTEFMYPDVKGKNKVFAQDVKWELKQSVDTGVAVGTLTIRIAVPRKLVETQAKAQPKLAVQV